MVTIPVVAFVLALGVLVVGYFFVLEEVHALKARLFWREESLRHAKEERDRVLKNYTDYMLKIQPRLLPVWFTTDLIEDEKGFDLFIKGGQIGSAHFVWTKKLNDRMKEEYLKKLIDKAGIS